MMDCELLKIVKVLLKVLSTLSFHVRKIRQYPILQGISENMKLSDFFTLENTGPCKTRQMLKVSIKKLSSLLFVRLFGSIKGFSLFIKSL